MLLWLVVLVVVEWWMVEVCSTKGVVVHGGRMVVGEVEVEVGMGRETRSSELVFETDDRRIGIRKGRIR